MKVLITGAAGRLGSALRDRLKDQHDLVGADIVGDDVERLDITDYAATCALIERIQPELVLHPAAWTDVDGCAREPEKAILINGVGTQNVALAARKIGAGVLYVSSNEVFDGKSSRPYTEYDYTQPINPYGYSKWYGERALIEGNPKHMIVRTAWLFAHGGKNFIQAILNAAEAGKSLRVVTNEVANPTYNEDVADAICQLIETGRYGTYHFVNAGACSRYDFARYVLDRTGHKGVSIARISASEWPRPSLPPEYAALSNIAGASIGITLRLWQEAVDVFLQKEGLLVS